MCTCPNEPNHCSVCGTHHVVTVLARDCEERHRRSDDEVR